MLTTRGRSGGAQTRSGKRTSHEYTLYMVLQLKIILPSKRIVYLLKTYSSCRFTQFRNKHFRHLPFLSVHYRDISVLSDKASAVDNQRPEAVGGQAHVALSLTYYCFDWILEWVAMPFSRRPSQPRDQNWNSCILGGFFTIWATRESRLIHSSFYHLETAEISIVNFQPPFLPRNFIDTLLLVTDETKENKNNPYKMTY